LKRRRQRPDIHLETDTQRRPPTHPRTNPAEPGSLDGLGIFTSMTCWQE
jgi:hypothetical protein